MDIIKSYNAGEYKLTQCTELRIMAASVYDRTRTSIPDRKNIMLYSYELKPIAESSKKDLLIRVFRIDNTDIDYIHRKCNAYCCTDDKIHKYVREQISLYFNKAYDDTGCIYNINNIANTNILSIQECITGITFEILVEGHESNFKVSNLRDVCNSIMCDIYKSSLLKEIKESSISIPSMDDCKAYKDCIF